MTRRPDGTIEGWDPGGVDRLAKPCYDEKGLSAAPGFLRAMTDGLDAPGWGPYQVDHEDANFQYEINFRYSDALTSADRLTFFRTMAGEVRRDRDLHAQALRRPDWLGRPRPLPPGRRRDRPEPVPRRIRRPGARAVGGLLSLPRRCSRTRPGSLRGHVSRGQLLQAAPERPGAVPRSLPEALDAFEADPVVWDSLGPIAGEFLRLKREEWREYHAQVEAWEVRRYLTAL